MGVRVGLLLSDFLGPLTFDRFSLLRVYSAWFEGARGKR